MQLHSMSVMMWNSKAEGNNDHIHYIHPSFSSPFISRFLPPFSKDFTCTSTKKWPFEEAVLTSDLSLSCQTPQPVMSCRQNTYSGPLKYFGLFSCTLKYLNVIVLVNKIFIYYLFIFIIYFKETWCQAKTFDKKILSFKTIDKWSEDKNTLCMSDVTGIRA